MKNILEQKDCLEFMAGLPDKSISVILTDPPFFAPASHYQSRISWGRCWGDLSILGQAFYDWCRQFKRILKDDGHLFCFCNDESYPVFYPVAYGLWDFTASLIWDKTRIGLGKIFRHQHEMIMWASNKGATVFNDGVCHSDVLKYPATMSKDRLHPVEKPVALLKELLTVSCPGDGIVYDPFAGGGSTIIAAMEMNLDWLATEINPVYFNVIQEKIKSAPKDKGGRETAYNKPQPKMAEQMNLLESATSGDPGKE